jgi:uncharacterized SAM-binding protein YcdF (DUF218 family)
VGVIRLVNRLLRWTIALYALTFLAVVIQTASFSNPAFETLSPVDTIVCLGAGMDADGTLHDAAIRRVETCVALYDAGAAEKIHFTGGRAVPEGQSAGGQMAALAIELGIPITAISTEDASQSTLQNALFSQPMLNDAQSLRLVTEAFHLPRAYASFALMGHHDIHLTMSEPVRLTSKGNWNWRVLSREALAIWFNASRYLVWLGGSFFGLEGHGAVLA